MIGGFLGGLANLGGVVQGANQAQDSALRRALHELALQQERQQQQSLESVYGGALNLGRGGGMGGMPGGLPQGGMPQAQSGAPQQPQMPGMPGGMPGGMPDAVPGGIPGGIPQQSGTPPQSGTPEDFMPNLRQRESSAGLPVFGGDPSSVSTVKGSVFGDMPGWPDKMAGSTTASGRPVSDPGIALRIPKSSPDFGKMYDVTMPSGKTYQWPQTDYGPAEWTGRGVDISAGAAQQAGYTKDTFPTDKPIRIHPAVQQTVNQTGQEAIQAKLPPPAVRESSQTALRAGSDLDPRRFGGYDVPTIAQAIEKATPNAPVAVKALALMQLHKLMAPDQQQLVRMEMQQVRNEMTIGLKEATLEMQRQNLEERRRHDIAIEGRPTAGDTPSYQPYTTPGGDVVAFDTKSGRTQEIPELKGATRVGPARAGAQEGEQLFKDLQAARASNDPNAIKTAMQAINDHNTALGKGVGGRGGPQAQYQAQYKQEHPDATAAEILKAGAEYRRSMAIETAFAGGIMGRNVVSLNTVSDHLKLAREYFEALHNGDIPRANQLANFVAVEAGKPEVTSFNAGRDIMTGEVVRLLTSTGGTENDRSNMRSLLDARMSEGQGRGALQVFDRFIGGRFKALEQQYAHNDPERRATFENEFLSPESRELYDRIKAYDAAAGRPPAAATPASPAAPAAPAAGQKYGSASEVYQAYESGALTRTQAMQVLKDQFGVGGDAGQP